jgi:hypothetical protein
MFNKLRYGISQTLNPKVGIPGLEEGGNINIESIFTIFYKG